MGRGLVFFMSCKQSLEKVLYLMTLKNFVQSCLLEVPSQIIGGNGNKVNPPAAVCT